MAARRLFLIVSILLSFVGTAELVLLGEVCSTTDNFTVYSKYQVNLGVILGELPRLAIANRGYSNDTVGEAPNKIFGMAMCYADRNWTECQQCLQVAAAGVQQVCPLSRQAKACYDACVLRYSDDSFLSVADLDIAWYVIADGSFVADVAAMNDTRWSLMTGLAAEAATSSLRLANGSKEYTDSRGDSQVIYGLAQCTRDLNASECTRCLTYIAGQFWTYVPNNTYGTVKAYSCYVAYQIGAPLGITIPPAAAAPPLSLPPATV